MTSFGALRKTCALVHGTTWATWIAAVWACAVPAFARVEPPSVGRTSYRVAFATSPIRVDGVLDEPAWASALVIPLDYEFDPGDNAPPPERTECLVTFDAGRLYVAFRAYDRDPEAIRAHLADRDTAFLDDTVGFLVDPFNDERRAFQFRSNPLGVQMDALNNDLTGAEDWSWDAIWESRGHIGPDGYVVEMAVPFSSLRFPRSAQVQTWGFAAERDLPRSLRHRLRSSRTDRDRACRVCQLDKLTGFTGIAPGLNLEFDPTLTAGRSDARAGFPDGPLERGGTDVDPGLSARWSVTPNLSLNGALNPDFSQVEADAAQLEVNTRFALFYPEKRPFFLEGADLFSTPIQAIFTRTISDPAWGLKLTGKEGAHALGLFVMRDEGTSLLFPANQGSRLGFLDQRAWSAAARYRRDVARGANVGALLTLRQGDGYHNRVAGLDGLARLSSSTALRAQFLHSSTEYPDATAEGNGQPRGPFDGTALYLRATRDARVWNAAVTHQRRSRGFRADSGFVPQVDWRNTRAAVERVFWPARRTFYSRWSVGVSALHSEDTRGRTTERGLNLWTDYSGPAQTFLHLNPQFIRETFAGREFDLNGWNVQLEAQLSGALGLSFAGYAGQAIDFSNARPARELTLAPGFALKLGRGLNLALTHTSQRLEVDGRRLFRARLSELRMLYHLGLRSFVRAILQYTDVTRDPAVYLFPVGARERTLFSQLLFSYKLNPQTVLLLGYSDDRLGLRPGELVQTGRTFFFKVGYAWVLSSHAERPARLAARPRRDVY